MTSRPPRDWCDWVAVERAWQGKPVGRPLSAAEYRSVIARADDDLLPNPEIATRLGVSEYTVIRWRRKLALPSPITGRPR
jgi:hypothetical protein